MGQDKALMPFLGKPLISRVLDQLGSLAQETIIVAGHPDAYVLFNLKVVKDKLPGRGALGGLYTGLLDCKSKV